MPVLDSCWLVEVVWVMVDVAVGVLVNVVVPAVVVVVRVAVPVPAPVPAPWGRAEQTASREVRDKRMKAFMAQEFKEQLTKN